MLCICHILTCLSKDYVYFLVTMQSMQPFQPQIIGRFNNIPITVFNFGLEFPKLLSKHYIS